MEAIEAQINGDGAHFLFPSGADKGAALALLNKTTNASFPAKEFQSKAKATNKVCEAPVISFGTNERS